MNPEAIPGVWRGGTRARIEAMPTGHAELDGLLPGGGWPVGALTELLLERPGCGELQLVLPHLARLTQAGGRAALVGTPHVPYAPAFATAGVVLARLLVVNPGSRGAQHWAAEQLLRSGAFGAVLAWPGALDGADLRRLQLAAETGRATGLLFRERRYEEQASPAALRLSLERQAGAIAVHLLKCRGAAPGARLRLAA